MLKDLPLVKSINPEGYRFIAIFLGVSFLCLLFGWSMLGKLFFFLALFTAFFFRDPERFAPMLENAVASPADGKVLLVDQLDGSEVYGRQKCIKISIFMSLFDVHVNRIPINGTIVETRYHPGKFFSANLDKASAENERQEVILETFWKSRIAFVQIAGLVARRIVCNLAPEDKVVKSERFGLIRFGSRLDVYLPVETIINVHPGQRVRAGETVLGYLHYD
ncbi:MAG: phosphatidylserine decarboxylase family protein [Deltaproteobacteria bacterium]|nr:phosphatidylserine decarboxylase family protein [Candidatus Anaeroferrophillus wilburensis]MBN2888078.1 phosphatidylserine decarboxylase family protein [Deltaproteobacteria bacterium]